MYRDSDPIPVLLLHRIVVSCSIVFPSLELVSSLHEVSLQGLHLLLPLVVSESIATKPPRPGEVIVDI